METLGFFLFFFPFVFSAYTALCGNICSPSTCGGTRPDVRFPFRLRDRQNDRCGYPRFDLSCNNQNRTVINLPSSSGGDFIVKRIIYASQSIFINDPDCLPKRILSLNFSGSPFKSAYPRSFTFLNCTSLEPILYPAAPISCLSGENYTVLAVDSNNPLRQSMPPSCRIISTVSVPVQRFFYEYGYMDLSEDIHLTWDDPNCGGCVAEGGTCGFKSDTGTKYGCFKRPSRGLPRSAKYGIIVGALIPGLVCLIGLVCYTCNKIRAYSRRRQLNNEVPITFTSQPAMTGLDGPTIESFPKTVLGESGRLPKPNDGTCPICLSEYQPKETLRTVPECNHYFHADCIDEWLRINATCPLCRNSADGSSVVTPCSSMSLSLSSSSSSSVP
ncbi:hypothetical protein F0562_035514 [Nyssa sinensis]|uniref:RING-type E3 ubiquitin transferase n=1 Tax=Nyssa sinensis TaxID=561372 RepID=A0A5J5AB34_9ASTE|nr:hypothetical protein F0562_035514 [Nyssa sinensis]